MKIHKATDTHHMFYCPACDCAHSFITGPGGWQFNGSMEAPTVTPSLLTTSRDPNYRCHLFITAGRLQYCADCNHELAGQTVDIPDWPY